MFRTGQLAVCPAEISLIVGAVVVRRRGLFEVDGADGGSSGTTGTTGHFAFEEPVGSGDLELLRDACLVAEPLAPPRYDGHREVLHGTLAAEGGDQPLWLRPSDN